MWMATGEQLAGGCFRSWKSCYSVTLGSQKCVQGTHEPGCGSEEQWMSAYRHLVRLLEVLEALGGLEGFNVSANSGSTVSAAFILAERSMAVDGKLEYILCMCI